MLDDIKKSTVIKKRCEYVKECIDKAAEEAREQKLNPVKRFAYIVDKYYLALYDIYEVETKWRDNYHTVYDFDGIVDEDVEIYALEYLDPYFQDMIKEGRRLAQKVVNSEYICDLMDNYEKLLEYMNSPIVKDWDSLIKGTEVHVKRKKI